MTEAIEAIKREDAQVFDQPVFQPMPLGFRSLTQEALTVKEACTYINGLDIDVHVSKPTLAAAALSRKIPAVRSAHSAKSPMMFFRPDLERYAQGLLAIGAGRRRKVRTKTEPTSNGTKAPRSAKPQRKSRPKTAKVES